MYLWRILGVTIQLVPKFVWKYLLGEWVVDEWVDMDQPNEIWSSVKDMCTRSSLVI